MPINPTTLKASIDTQITNETVDFAITPAEVGGRMKDCVDYTTEQSALKENVITATTSAQYYRGDKTFADLNKSAVGLGNVDNTSDTNKPVSIAQQAALDLKEDKTKSMGDVSATSSSYPTLTKDINNIIGTYDGHVLLPETTQVGKRVIVSAPSIRFYVDVSNISTMSISFLRNADVVTSFQVQGSSNFEFIYIGDGKWIANRIGDFSLKVDGFFLSTFSDDNNLAMTFYSSDTTEPSLSTLNLNYSYVPNGFRIFYPNISGGALMITKLYSGVFYKTALGTQIT